jgi:hypothetical protein
MTNPKYLFALIALPNTLTGCIETDTFLDFPNRAARHKACGGSSSFIAISTNTVKVTPLVCS